MDGVRYRVKGTIFRRIGMFMDGQILTEVPEDCQQHIGKSIIPIDRHGNEIKGEIPTVPPQEKKPTKAPAPKQLTKKVESKVTIRKKPKVWVFPAEDLKKRTLEELNILISDTMAAHEMGDEFTPYEDKDDAIAHLGKEL